MKKSDIILVVVVLALVCVGIFSTKGTKEEEPIEYPLTLNGKAGLQQITYSEYDNKVNNNEAFIIIIERTGCGYCEMYMPIVEEVVNEVKIPIYYIDTETLTEEEFNLLSTTNAYLKKNQWGTPTTLFMLGSRVLDSIGGYVEKEAILNFLNGKVVLGA